MPRQLIHNATAHRYEIHLDGTLAGFADYHDADGSRDFSHTMTFPEFRGQGVAGELVEFALTDTRAAQLKVIPTCWYVAEFIAKHPEHAELVQAGR